MRFNKEKDGSVGTILLIGVLVVSLLATLGFGVWAFSERSDYKSNSDKKAAEAVEVALAEQKETLDAEYAEKEKQPFESFQSSADLGNITFQFPKTWELYVETEADGSKLLSGYAHPGYVPSIRGDTSFALRFEVVNTEYTKVIDDFDNAAKRGAVRISPYRADKVPSVLGARVEGEVEQKKTGSMVVLPIRDKTLRIWSEGSTFQPDFNTLLTSLTFSP